ncbi:ATPase H+ transporting accessory protein 1a [Tachysurus ichikawai]
MKLSVDDFTKYAGVFGSKQGSAFPNLESMLQSSSSLLLPSVLSLASASLPTLLQDELNTAPLYMDPDTLAQLRLNASVPALLIFSLPYSSSG